MGMNSTNDEGEAATLHADVLSDGRRRSLLIMLPLMGAVILLSGRVHGGPGGSQLLTLLSSFVVGAGLLVATLALAKRWIEQELCSIATIALIGVLMVVRTIVSLPENVGGHERQIFFTPFFAYLPAFYILTVLLLPYPKSRHFGIAAWLAEAAVTVIGSADYWGSPSPQLYGLLLYVTFGNGLFVFLIYGWARQQSLMLEQYSALASSERSARTALEATERRFRGVFEQAAVGVALIGGNGALQQVNGKLCELTGYTEDELYEIDLSELTFPEDRQGVAERTAALVTGRRESYTLERRVRRKDGSVAWVQVFVRSVASEAGDHGHVVLIAIDINERKRAEQQALEHQRVREFHFENTPLAVIEWTADLRVQRWSKRAEEMFGWRAEEVVGLSPLEWRFVYDDDREATEAVIAKLFSGNSTLVTNLNRNYHKNGSALWCLWYNSVLRDDQGQMLSFISMVEDITEQQNTIVALNASEARFRSIFEQASVGITMVDDEGRWLAINRRFCDIVGYTESELKRINWRALRHGEDADDDRAAQLTQNNAAGVSVEKRFLHKNGQVIWAMVFMRAIAATPTAPRCVLYVVEDITERKLAEAQVQRLTADLEKTVVERTQQLQRTMRSWAERNNELSILAEMMGVLPAARDTREGSQIVAGFLPRLFSRCGGAIYLEAGMTDLFPLLTHWRIDHSLKSSIVADDCWALRRGQMLRIEDPADPLLCPHVDAPHGDQHPHVCMPITALGDAVGMIYLEWSERAGSTSLPPDSVLLATVSEQIGLAIGNIRLREELRRQAIHDPLTGLYNRRHFDECMLRRVAEYKRSKVPFVMMMIDLDHFKAINDGFGHDSGDEVLRIVAALLKRIVAADESVFRLGGEEFVVLTEDRDGSGGFNLAERIRREVEKLRIVHKGHMLDTVTVSIGIANYPDDSGDHIALVQVADAALYVAKRSGRNRVNFANAFGQAASTSTKRDAEKPAPRVGH